MRLLAPIYRPIVPFLPLVAALGLVAGLLEGVGIGLFIPLLAFLLSDDLATNLPGPIRALAALFDPIEPRIRTVLLSGAILAMILIKNGVQAASDYLAAKIEGRVGSDIRTRLSERLIALDYAFFLQHDPARLSRILSVDSWLVVEASRSMLTLVPAVASLFVFAAMLAWLNLELFLILLVGAAVIQLLLYGAGRRREKLSRTFTQSDLTFWNRFIALADAPKVIRVFGQQDRERRDIAQSIEGLEKSAIALQHQAAVVHAVVDSLIAILFLALLFAGIWNDVSIPVISAFLILAVRAQPQAKEISSARLGIAAVRGAIEEVEWLLSQRPAAIGFKKLYSEFRLDQPIRFIDVSFDYPNDTRALNVVNLTIEPNKRTALIGNSGSGKTTIVNLLCRLIDPTSGEVVVGQQSAATLDLQQWRSRVAIAGQDAELMSGTVLENIAYGRIDATQAEIEAVARASHASDFIASLPNGYATLVGPRGFSLSVGQRQRIGLARALLRRPDLLILDEATNAVDALSESEILELISENRFFQTLLIIGHRQSTLAACQHGIVLDKGKVRETGQLANLAYFQTMGESFN